MTAIADELELAEARVATLRSDLGRLRTEPLNGLVRLDIDRALTALGSAEQALHRGRRHADLGATT